MNRAQLPLKLPEAQPRVFRYYSFHFDITLYQSQVIRKMVQHCERKSQSVGKHLSSVQQFLAIQTHHVRRKNVVTVKTGMTVIGYLEILFCHSRSIFPIWQKFCTQEAEISEASNKLQTQPFCQCDCNCPLTFLQILLQFTVWETELYSSQPSQVIFICHIKSTYVIKNTVKNFTYMYF